MAGSDTRERDFGVHVFPCGAVRGASYRRQCEEGVVFLQALQHRARVYGAAGTDNIGGHWRSSLGWKSESACRASRGVSARTLYCEKCWPNPVASLGVVLVFVMYRGMLRQIGYTRDGAKRP